MNTQQHPNHPPQLDDWHRADIVAALHKAGWSLRELSLYHGYAYSGTLTNALDRPWPKGEHLISEAIGIAPATIWPSRYDAAGKPLNRRGYANIRNPKRVMPVKQGPRRSGGAA